MPRPPRTSPRGFDVGIRHIRAVNSVALYGSFTAAAADLGMTQSAVSRLVLQLEKQLGVSLFLRSTRNVVLTAPGREFTASTRRLIEDLNIQVENARATAVCRSTALTPGTVADETKYCTGLRAHRNTTSWPFTANPNFR